MVFVICFGLCRIFNESAKSDDSLSFTELESLSYTVTGVDRDDDEEENIDSAQVISSKLKLLSDLVEKVIENDKKIEEQDNEVIMSTFPIGDEVDSSFNYEPIKEHIMKILQNFFSYEEIKNCKLLMILVSQL